MTRPLDFSLAVLKEKGSSRFEGEVQPEDLEQPLTDQAVLSGPVGVAVEALFRDGSVQLEGRARGKWELDCCRCLARTKKGFDVKIDAVVEEPGETVDGLEELRQSLILSVPTQAYCREECRGLCPQCGANRNEKDCGHDVRPPSRFKITRRGTKDNA